jgi:hypothetical protein
MQEINWDESGSIIREFEYENDDFLIIPGKDTNIKF